MLNNNESLGSVKNKNIIIITSTQFYQNPKLGRVDRCQRVRTFEYKIVFLEMHSIWRSLSL